MSDLLVKYGRDVSPARGPAPSGTSDLAFSVIVPGTSVPDFKFFCNTASAVRSTLALSCSDSTMDSNSALGAAGIALPE